VIGERFHIEAVVGRGAMADVYRAFDRGAKTHVAVKIMKRHLSEDLAIRQRFSREADVQAKLRHPNIAALYATGVTAQDEPYLVVELLRGKTLRHLIKSETRVDPRRAMSYAWQALQGLAVVHQSGVLHRDLKPANIMLEAPPGPIDPAGSGAGGQTSPGIERAVLIDFGFASLEGAAKLTAQGVILGSLSYVAPERLRGELPDRRSDLYAIGVILFEMLSGTQPFAAVNDVDLAEMHLHTPPPQLDAALPQALRDVVGRALGKLPAERYGDAIEMAEALEAAARTMG
jgi:serine/threonine-protein kinase